jgi:DNA-binding MarR family transcriptional regulator
MGSRFLKIDFLGPDFDEDAHMDAAEEAMSNKGERKKKLLHAVLGRYKYLHENAKYEDLPIIPIETKAKLKALAKLLAKVRGKVSRDRVDGINYRPEEEVATRIYLQLLMYIRCLAYVRNHKKVEHSDFVSIRRIVFNSCPQLSFEVVEYIHRKKRVTRKDIANDLKLPTNRVNRIIEDFHAMELVDKTRNKEEEGAGASQYFYSLSENLNACFDTVKKKDKYANKTSSKIHLSKRSRGGKATRRK